MAKPATIRELDDIAQALSNWFISQEVTTGRAVAAMGYLIGIIAAEASNDTTEIMTKLQSINTASKVIAFGAFAVKGGR